MKKLSAIAAVVFALFAVFYFSAAVQANRADTAPSLSSPSNGATITSSDPISFQFSLGSYSTVNLKVFKAGSEIRHLNSVTSSPVSESSLLGSNGAPDGMITVNASDYEWRVYGTTGDRLVSELFGFTIQRTQ